MPGSEHDFHHKTSYVDSGNQRPQSAAAAATTITITFAPAHDDQCGRGPGRIRGRRNGPIARDQ
eukprot:2966071-Prymnesium_polylepis.1